MGAAVGLGFGQDDLERHCSQVSKSVLETREEWGDVKVFVPNRRPLTVPPAGRNEEPSVSLDGRELVFLRRTQEGTWADLNRQIRTWIIGSDRESVVEIERYVPPGLAISRVGSPRLDPSREFIYFIAYDSDTSGQLTRFHRKSRKTEVLLKRATEYCIAAPQGRVPRILAAYRCFARGQMFLLLDMAGRRLGAYGEIGTLGRALALDGTGRMPPSEVDSVCLSGW